MVGPVKGEIGELETRELETRDWRLANKKPQPVMSEGFQEPSKLQVARAVSYQRVFILGRVLWKKCSN